MPINTTPPTPADFERTIAQHREYALAFEAKIDKVRDWAHHIRSTRQRGDTEYNAAADVLAILDEEPGD